MIARLLASLVALACTTASAEIITRCGESNGWSYYFAQPLVPKKDVGFNKDGIKGGDTLLMSLPDGRFDIVFKDAMGRTVSSLDDGAQVVPLSKEPERLVLLVVYAGMSAETWYFRLDDKGRGEVTYSQARFGERAIFSKHSLLRAPCAR